MSPRLLIMVGALIAGLMLPLSAEAAPAQSRTALHMRTGPGVGYAVITVIPGGGWVEILDYAPNGWCLVRWAGYEGWSSCRYLAGVAEPRYVYPRPNVELYLGFPFGGWFYDYDRHYHPHYKVVPKKKYQPKYDYKKPRFDWKHDFRDHSWRQ